LHGEESSLASNSTSPPKERKRCSVSPNESIVKVHHKCLLSSKGKVPYLLSRGINEESIETYKLGYGKPYPSSKSLPRYTIPIFNQNDDLVTIKYRVDEEIDDSSEKYLSHPGSGLFLFNTSVLPDNDTIVFCGGQLDAILLSQHGIPSVAPPSEGIFRKEWSGLFDGKKVYVLLDNDKAGRSGTVKVSSLIRGSIPVYWPRGFKIGYDINDAILDYKVGINGIVKLLERVDRSKRAVDSW